MKQEQAISGSITGNDQHVGFRAAIMKQAIAYNLAGFAEKRAQRRGELQAPGRRGPPG